MEHDLILFFQNGITCLRFTDLLLMCYHLRSMFSGLNRCDVKMRCEDEVQEDASLSIGSSVTNYLSSLNVDSYDTLIGNQADDKCHTRCVSKSVLLHNNHKKNRATDTNLLRMPTTSEKGHFCILRFCVVNGWMLFFVVWVNGAFFIFLFSLFFFFGFTVDGCDTGRIFGRIWLFLRIVIECEWLRI